LTLPKKLLLQVLHKLLLLLMMHCCFLLRFMLCSTATTLASGSPD
jgi:hypothetical protein